MFQTFFKSTKVHAYNMNDEFKVYSYHTNIPHYVITFSLLVFFRFKSVTKATLLFHYYLV